MCSQRLNASARAWRYEIAGKTVTFRAKEGGGLIVNGEEHLRVPVRLEPAHHLLPPSGVPMLSFT